MFVFLLVCFIAFVCDARQSNASAICAIISAILFFLFWSHPHSAKSIAGEAELAREAELQEMKDIARRAREAEEHFDPHTTFDYLTKLGRQFGSIYVNDAPLASLTTSNSVAEIKC